MSKQKIKCIVSSSHQIQVSFKSSVIMV